MPEVILECPHCYVKVKHDLKRVLRGLTLRDVQEYLAPTPAPQYSCGKCATVIGKVESRRRYKQVRTNETWHYQWVYYCKDGKACKDRVRKLAQLGKE